MAKKAKGNRASVNLECTEMKDSGMGNFSLHYNKNRKIPLTKIGA